MASLALGLVLTWRTSRVVNFAHAAMGTYLAYAYFEFRDRGDLVLPFLGLPERVHLPEWMTVAGLMAFGSGVHPHWDKALAEELRTRLDLPADTTEDQLAARLVGLNDDKGVSGVILMTPLPKAARLVSMVVLLCTMTLAGSFHAT